MKKRSEKSIYIWQEPNLSCFHSPETPTEVFLSPHILPLHLCNRAVLGKWSSQCCKGLWELRQRPWTALCIKESVLSAEHQADVLTVMIVAKQRELIAVFCTEVFRMCGLAEWSGGQECIGQPGQTQAQLNGTPLMEDGKGKFATMVVGICSSKEFKRSTRLHMVLSQSHASPP